VDAGVGVNTPGIPNVSGNVNAGAETDANASAGPSGAGAGVTGGGHLGAGAAA
jgi:hypothetical protein